MLLRAGRKCTSEKLPRPEFGTFTSSVKNSVFSNPFVEAENAKKAILEKHVKMTPTRDEIKTINGKKICWNFRKGRCRFGHNCKFAHDSDLPQAVQSEEEETNENNSHTIVSTIEDDCNINSEKNSHKLNSKKKRPGLSQSIVPGKKVLKVYKRQKVNESV